MHRFCPVAGLILCLTLHATAFAQARARIALPGGPAMEFVWIAPGTFTMGIPPFEGGPNDGRGTQRETTISRGFWLGRFEITQAQWEGVMGDNPSHFSGRADLPVDSVSWVDLQAFIGALNAAAGDSLFRLPTEAEWEYAARSGTTTTWAFGDDEGLVGDYAWYGENSDLQTHPVGTRRPNPWGLYDMYGNLWEWVQDWHSDFYWKEAPAVDPPGPASGFLTRVLKSCFFNCGPLGMTPSNRSKASATFRFNHVGGRLLYRGGPPATAAPATGWGALKNGP